MSIIEDGKKYRAKAGPKAIQSIKDSYKTTSCV
jgi:hypothetical protein